MAAFAFFLLIRSFATDNDDDGDDVDTLDVDVDVEVEVDDDDDGEGDDTNMGFVLVVVIVIVAVVSNPFGVAIVATLPSLPLLFVDALFAIAMVDTASLDSADCVGCAMV